MMNRLAPCALRIVDLPFEHGLARHIADDSPGGRGRSVARNGVGVSQGDDELPFAHGQGLAFQFERREIADRGLPIYESNRKRCTNRHEGFCQDAVHMLSVRGKKITGADRSSSMPL